MPAPEPLSVRAYHLSVKGYRADADRALRDIRRQIDQIDTSRPGAALSLAQRTAPDLAELITRLAMLKALDEVSFLTTDPDAKEA